MPNMKYTYVSLVKLYFAADLRLFPEYNNYSDIKVYKKGQTEFPIPSPNLCNVFGSHGRGDIMTIIGYQ